MRISSRLGLGTRVDLWLPGSQAPVQGEPRQAAVEPVAPRVGTVLLVDDEEIVRASTADMLMDLGYEVVEAESAESALRELRAGLNVDLLVTDHLMPGMNGTDLAREVRSRWPGRAVLLISGFAEAEGVAPDLPRLTKPFRQADLASALASLASASRQLPAEQDRGSNRHRK